MGVFQLGAAGGTLLPSFRFEYRRCSPRKYRRRREEGHAAAVWRTLAPHPRRQETIGLAIGFDASKEQLFGSAFIV